MGIEWWIIIAFVILIAISSFRIKYRTTGISMYRPTRSCRSGWLKPQDGVIYNNANMHWPVSEREARLLICRNSFINLETFKL